MNKKYKAAVIGLGQIAYSIDKDKTRKIIWSHIKAYQHNDSFEITDIAEINRELLDSIGNEINIKNRYTDYKEMLKDETLSVISICTPIPTHAQIIRECLKHSNIKVIFCEKTLSYDFEEAKKLVEECKQNNVLLMINHILRWDCRINNIRDIIKNETLGKVSSVVAYSNTALHTSASHMIDVLSYLFDNIEVVYGQKQTNFVRVAHGHKDYGGFAFLKSNDVPIFLKCNSDNPLKFLLELDIFFENGRLRSWNNLEKQKLYEFKNKVSKTGANYMMLEEIKEVKPVKENQRMLLAIESIASYLKDNKNIPVSTGETSLTTLNIIERILE